MRRTKRGKRRRGSFLVELAITVPIFINLLGMIIEMGLMLWLKNHLVWVARDACRDGVAYKEGFNLSDSALTCSSYLAYAKLSAHTRGGKAPNVAPRLFTIGGQWYLEVTVSARYRPAMPLTQLYGWAISNQTWSAWNSVGAMRLHASATMPVLPGGG